MIRVGAMWILVLVLVTFTSFSVNGYLKKKRIPGLCPTPEEAGFESEASNIYAEHVAQMFHICGKGWLKRVGLAYLNFCTRQNSSNVLFES